MATARDVEEKEESGAAPARLRREFVAFYVDSYSTVARALGLALADPDLGAEAADEAMARCFSRWGRMQDHENPTGWVFRVGLHRARSARRRLGRRSSGHSPVSDSPAPIVADPDIQRALLELSTRLRGVLVGRFLLEWSVPETAAALRLRRATVKRRTTRALNLLQNKLYQYQGEV